MTTKTFTHPRPDGVNLFVREWPVANPNGSILMVHGLGEHNGRYEALAQWLVARGFWVRALDLRGHGQSGGARGVMRRDDDHVRDVVAMMEALRVASGQLPMLLGHSMGGLICTSIAVRRMTPLRALIASSPAFDAGLSVVQKGLISVMCRVSPDMTVSNGLEVDAISHDIHVANAYKNDSLVHRRISPRLARFIQDEGMFVREQAAQLNVPALLIYAEADRLVSPNGSREFAARAPADLLTVKSYEGAYHELFNELPQYRELVLNDLNAWLEQQFLTTTT